MLRVVDKTETHVIQKVINDRSGETLGFQTIPNKGVEGKPQRFLTLKEARKAAGREIAHPVKDTLSKKAALARDQEAKRERDRKGK